MIAAFSIHRTLLRSALSAALLFSWVMLFELELVRTPSITQALSETALIFILSQIATILAAPLAGRLYGNGMVRSMVIALLSLAFAFAFLGAAYVEAFGSLCLAYFGIFIGIYRAFYTVPSSLMHDDMPLPDAATETVIACVPFAAAIVLAAGYEPFLLWAAAAVVVAAILPLLRFDAYEKYEWTYRETFGMLLEPAHRSFVGQSLLRGYEGAALFFAWPLFLYTIIEPSYLPIGLIATGSLLLMFSLRSIHPRPIRDPAVAAAISAGAWVGRVSIGGPIGGILVQTLGEAGRPDARSHAAYEVLSDHGTFLDEITTLKEIALAFGRILLALAALALLHAVQPFTVFGILFVGAAVAAAVSEYIGRSREKAL